MTEAIITITDLSDGGVNVHIAFGPEGTEPGSPAHHYAVRMLSALTEAMARDEATASLT